MAVAFMVWITGSRNQVQQQIAETWNIDSVLAEMEVSTPFLAFCSVLGFCHWVGGEKPESSNIFSPLLPHQYLLHP